MEPSSIAVFASVAAVIVVTPGADVALVTKNALVYGRSSALHTAFGINLGVMIWTIACAVGLATLIQASAVVFSALKWAGAAYLVFLGLRSLLRAVRPPPFTFGPVADRRAFRQGLVSNLLNPKVALFYTTLLPQFVSADGSALVQSLVFGLIFNLLGLIWLSAYGIAVARVRNSLRPWWKRPLDGVSGAVLIGLGIRLLTDSRVVTR